MNTLDDLLDAAAIDLQRAVAQVPIPSSFAADGLSAMYRRPARARAAAYRSRRFLVAGAAIAAFVVGGLFLIERRPADRPADNPGPSVSSPTTTTPPLFDAAHPPVALTNAPAGYALVGQFVRPAGGGQNLRSAIFVHRDAKGIIDGKVLARFGNFQLIGVNPSDGSLPPADPGFYQQAVTPPTNLTAATSGNVYIELDARVIHLQFPLGDLGSLTLDSFNLDAATDLAVTQQMQQIAATLQLTPTAIDVTGTLPDGWALAVAGTEPETVNQNFSQAFEVDTPDGGNKVIISNMSTNDSGMPYWEMDETLQPIDIRGHAGFVSTHHYPPTNTNAPPPANPSGATTLIWPESPDHWVVVRADDMNTAQVLALANQLTPSSNGQWQQAGAPGPTTTTIDPTRPT
jgi:hypothetical protein